MARRRRYFIFVAALVCLLAVVLILKSGMANPSKPEFLTPPTPNGFELLTIAAWSVQGVEPRGTSPHAYLEQNSESLKLMREAVHHPAELPEKFYKRKNSPMPELGAILRLGDLAKLQAAQYQKEGNFDAAADIYLDLVRMSHRVQRGIMISVLFGLKIETKGLEGLNAVAPHLSADKRQSLATELASLRETAITLNHIQERELYFFQKNVPLGTAFAHRLPRFKDGILLIQPRLARIRQDLEETRLKLQTK